MKRKSMRLLVLGDQSVGKTSLIYAIMSEVPGQLVKTLKKVILPPDMCMYSKQIFTEIIDTDSQTDINRQINEADIILLVYDVIEPQSIVRIQNHWLPIISNNSKEIPVILVGNKLDKKQLEIDIERQYTNIRSILKNVTKKYRQVQMGIQCSAYYDRNVKKVLNCAQRAVLYPLTPLYDLNTKELTEKFKKAIKRIFRILDSDFDGRLSDNQLRNLQQRVFQTELNGQDIKAIKQIIIRQLEQFNQDFINIDGFYALQKKCIQMLKIQVCWSILRYFNYNDKLDIIPLEEQFILDQKSGQSLELSSRALDFLDKIYTFSQNQKIETQGFMKRIFSCSHKVPLEQFKNQNLSLEKFLCSWQMYTFLDYKACYQSLLYIGYEDSLDATFKKVKSKKTYSDVLKLKDRKIFSILIIENKQYEKNLSLLFKNGVEDDFNIYTRDSFLYSNQHTTKIMLMIKVKEENIQKYLQNSTILNKIDLVLTFESNQGFDNNFNKKLIEQSDFSNKYFESHTMFRKLKVKECQQAFKLGNMPSLNLQTFPVQYKDENWGNLFQTILLTFQKIQLGYSVQKIQMMKRQSDKANKILTGVGIVGLMMIGVFVAKKKSLGWVFSK